MVLGFALATLLAALLAARVEVNAPLLSDLDPEHPIRRANRLLEERLGGAIPLDLLIAPPPGPAERAYARERLERIEALTQRLRALPEVRWATSPVDPLRRLAGVLRGVPPDEAPGLLPTALLMAHDQVAPWVDVDHDRLRIRLRIRDLDTAAAFALFARIDALQREVLGEPGAVQLTGQGYLAQVVNRDIVAYFRSGFLTGLLAVALTLLAFLRDARLALLSLLPNLFVVVVVAGAMGALGIELRYTSALVLSVVFGLAVDDTIHVLAQWRRQRGDPDPVGVTFRVTGPGLVLTSLLLVSGFGTLLWAELLPLRVMGGLLLLTAVVALAADLLLLPALLHLCVMPGGQRPPGSPKAPR